MDGSPDDVFALCIRQQRNKYQVSLRQNRKNTIFQTNRQKGLIGDMQEEKQSGTPFPQYVAEQTALFQQRVSHPGIPDL